ncbi:hypothetical protein FRC02_001132 [Tulasnella sp. 418]|nr:hypothetical protein FRC02_001132 [Tulasnella sp. 418]
MTDGTLEASSEEYEESWDTMSDGDSLFGDLGECDSDSSKNPRANTESHDVIDLTNDDDEDITDGFISTLPAPSWLSTGVDITSIRSDITQSTGSYIGSYVNTSLPDNPFQISDVELDLHLSSLLLTSGFPFETQALLPYLGSSSEVERSVNHRSNGQMFRPISNGSQDHMNGTIPVPTEFLDNPVPPGTSLDLR